MSRHSTDFLDIDNYHGQANLRRSRSGGYADNAEAQARLNRRLRYNDSKYSTFSTGHHRSMSDQLGIPVYNSMTRNSRSHDNIRGVQEVPSRHYNLEDRRPGPQPLYEYDLSSETIPSSQLLAIYRERPKPQKKPVIKVEIHQDSPPSSLTSATATPNRSPYASPHSPTAQPQLQYQYATLQNKLAQVGSICAPFVKVEAADPRDLTFAKIAELVDGYAFDLQVWAHVAKVENMARIDSQKRKVVEAASRNMDRLVVRVDELDKACAQAKPRDLKFEGLPEVDDDNLFDEDDRSIGGSTESLGFIIHSSLHSIELQVRTLKRLCRPLQEATPDAKDEIVAVSKLVGETAQYFGSQDALERYSIDTRFAGGKALDEARYAAGH